MNNPGPSMVDWGLAVAVGSRLAGQGPVVSREDAAAVVAELRAGAARSTGLVRDFSGLQAADDTAPVVVVDRPGWVQANADGFASVLAPVVDKLAGRARTSGVAHAVGSRVTGVEVGGLLGFLAGKVLGQFDPFHPPAGRLLLVAPNIVHVERELGVDPHDFRLWVCLHEETHRVQFTAVPWLGDHLLDQMHALADSLEPSGLLDDGFRRLTESLKGGTRGENLLEAVSTPEQKEIIDRVTGVMSLLEGHADVVMDGVGPQVIPTVADIRRRFNKRRKGVGALDRTLRRVLGLDAKMAQYRDGAKFVRAVVDKAGMAEFNAIFDRPENLPSKAEIAAPTAWISRVL
ncbi:zinc-dependent metalloprotease [Nocardioides sp. YIM 152315]|uniref:zinc-dependent metalloprotease n=1 Tax=Nocardioides sp. YIM 152315 TaxID=3031760 RepID=UPI0023DB4699|nr:zinc-dependent metalloprotease [Nocardioides sp. YIM 152315]MDF1606206.1 zinc-dependent metalloprotease [Nocardioides sp. YIM 152315]